jgi:hypothetical protein
MLMALECDFEKYSRFWKSRGVETGLLVLASPKSRNGSTDGNQTMTRFKILGAAAVLSMMMATPLFGQAAIQEPGAFAFYHPNADVLNGGRPTPAASGAMASVPLGASDAYAAMGGNANGSSCAQRYRSYDPVSGTFLGYDGHRHPYE